MKIAATICRSKCFTSFWEVDFLSKKAPRYLLQTLCFLELFLDLKIFPSQLTFCIENSQISFINIQIKNVFQKSTGFLQRLLQFLTNHLEIKMESKYSCVPLDIIRSYLFLLFLGNFSETDFSKNFIVSVL